MDALTFLDRAANSKPQPVYVLAGDEAFLKRQVRAGLEPLLLGDADPAFAVTSVAGDKAEWSAVRADLDTLPFLSPCRIVVVEAADPFVTKYRAILEKYVGQPSKVGVLVLDVKTWPATTKLAKLVPEAGTVTCKAPSTNKLSDWCRAWAQSRHDKKLDAEAAAWLVELVGPEMGLLDQELAKLAIYAGEATTIGRDDVDRLVGRSRAAETFKIFDAIGAGRSADALAILERLFEQGEEPLQLLGAFSWQLRRLGLINRHLKLGLTPAAALDQANVPPFARGGMEAQLRHLGRRRLDKVYDWLIEADLGMKGSSQLPPRVLLERFVVRMAQPRTAG